MLADFMITVHEARKPLVVQVKVHDNVDALRKAAKAYTTRSDISRNKRESNQSDFSDTLGICHRFHWSNTPLCAIVRLAPPHIGAGIVAHEMAHAAVWLWEIQNEFDDRSPINCETDEWFCWVLGELVRQTTIKLIEHDIY